MYGNTAMAVFREPPRLSVENHTRIVEAVMENPMLVIQKLDAKSLISRGERPSSAQVLEAMLKMRTVEEHTKHQIRKVLEILPALEEARHWMPRSTQRAMQ